MTLLDYGCGVGNGFFPLIEQYGLDNLRVNCCDISKTAVGIIKQHPLYQEQKIDARQCDLVNDEIPFEPNTADFGIFIFVLSAISPEKYSSVLKKLSEQMKVGGVVYFRDYGRFDMA